MIKSFIMGAVPLTLFFYLMMYHPYTVVIMALASAFVILSWLIGITYREEFGDLSDKNSNR